MICNRNNTTEDTTKAVSSVSFYILYENYSNEVAGNRIITYFCRKID